MSLAAILGEATVARAATAKVLVVGAGGIGCELLKNLVLCGIVNIDIIDLDTISVSNLNRQFLFRQSHVGRSKAEVAAVAMGQFCETAGIRAFHGSIFEPRFNYMFFKGYDLVFNALDNIPARRHVNRLCVLTGVPLIEAGTAGYLGQVTVIAPTLECYDCVPKPTPTVFPVCTIRSTPEKPIHCIVWAKYIFDRLYGVGEDEGGADAAPAPAADAPDHAAAAPEPSQKPLSNAELRALSPAELATHLFASEISKLLAMADLWKTRAPPVPLDVPALLAEAAAGPQVTVADASSVSAAQTVLTVPECVSRLLTVLAALAPRAAAGILECDKDDADAMLFVTAASNLRAECFGIPRSSLFDVRSMAGNIIPAIASTNAIAAALQVIEGLKLLGGQPLTACRTTFIQQYPAIGRRAVGRMLDPVQLELPAASCGTCRSDVFVLALPLARTTLRTLVHSICSETIGLSEPSVLAGSRLLYEPASDSEGEDDARMARTLAELGLGDGAELLADAVVLVLLDDPAAAQWRVVSQPDRSRKRIVAEEWVDDGLEVDEVVFAGEGADGGDVVAVEPPRKKARVE